MTSARSLTGRLFLLFTLLCAVAFPATAQQRGDLVILYENDVHCALHGYPVIAGLRDSLERKGCDVAVISEGDFSFGGLMGTASKGLYIIRLMNAVGYDAACLGNHEFDMGIPHLMKMDSLLRAPMLSCNFRSSVTGKGMMLPYVMRRYGNRKVAFVGVTTPSTLTSASPVYFQDGNGRYIYNFSPSNLAGTVQQWVNAARAAGADYVILMSHMGDEEGEQTSTQLIPQLQGVDAVLDGHDHHVIPQRILHDRLGNPVPLSSTGTQFQYIGMLTVKAYSSVRPTLTTQLFPTDSLLRVGCVNAAVRDTLEAILQENERLGNHHVADNPYFLESYDREHDLRVVRLRETNLGNLVADAFREVLQTDIGWVNGGAIRDNLQPPVINRNDLLAVTPFLNKACIGEVSGQEVLDALETAVKGWPLADGGFPQVSGLTFRFDTTVASTVVLDSNGVFLRVDGQRRVSDVRVFRNGEYEPLDPSARYTLASSDYVLLFGGDGIRFSSCRVLPMPEGIPAVMADIDLLEYYLTTLLKGSVPARYAQPQGRMKTR